MRAVKFNWVCEMAQAPCQILSFVFSAGLCYLWVIRSPAVCIGGETTALGHPWANRHLTMWVLVSGSANAPRVQGTRGIWNVDSTKFLCDSRKGLILILVFFCFSSFGKMRTDCSLLFIFCKVKFVPCAESRRECFLVLASLAEALV